MLARMSGTALVERWVAVDGYRLRYRGPRDVPAGPPDPRPVMVHVHGFAISGTYLLPTAERLAAEFRTFVPDLPGNGRSEGPRAPLTIGEQADALLAFCDAVGVERATFVGNSMGCQVLTELVVRAPERVDRSVLVSPAGGRHSRPLPRALGQMAVDAVLEPPSIGLVSVPDYLRFGLVRSFQQFSAMTKFPALDRFVSMAGPALTVVGSRDPLVPGPDRVAEVVALCPPGHDFVVISGSAHAVNYSHPDVLAHVIREWAAGRPVSDPPGTVGRVRVLRDQG